MTAGSVCQESAWRKQKPNQNSLKNRTIWLVLHILIFLPIVSGEGTSHSGVEELMAFGTSRVKKESDRLNLKLCGYFLK